MAITLDGASYLERQDNLARIASSGLGTVSFWYNPTTTAEQYFIQGTTPTTRFRVRIISGVIQILGTNSTGTAVLDLRSNLAVAADAWVHFAASWNLSMSTPQSHVYVNRTSSKNAVTATQGGIIDYEGCVGGWFVGVADGPAAYFTGQLDQLAFWPGVYVDLSDADNLRRFVSSDGLTDYANPGPTQGTVKPVGFGADGSFPTGTKPVLYYGGGFAKNLGTGGQFGQTGTFGASAGPATYRQHAMWNTPGERWFDSDRSGFSAPRSETFIEDREGIPGFGQRLRISERDDTTRLERPSHSFSRLVAGLDEDDSEDDRR